MPAEILTNLKLFGPELILIGSLVLLFLMDSLFPKTRENFAPLIVIIVGCLLSAVATYGSSQTEATLFFSGSVANDSLSAFFRYFFLFACTAAAYLGFGSKELAAKNRMEFSLLLICVTIGLSLMAIATNILVLYIGIETVSIVSFVMAGFNREDSKSSEASFKYLVFGALSSGLMIYGFSLVYGLAGSLQYGEIAKILVSSGEDQKLLISLTFIFIYAGLAYKLAAFPMHFWAPDIYEGSPTPIAAFFSVGPKAAGFAALLRYFLDVYSVKSDGGIWQPIGSLSLVSWVAILSAVTMVIGNLSALAQTSVKRILAYSSIAHVGYVLMGLVSFDNFGLQAILFYLLAYCGMNLGAFWVVSVVSDIKGTDNIEAFRGMGWSMPVLGVGMAVFLFSLTGIPMFSGFIGKFLLFSTVMKTPGFLWLALFGVLNSVVSLFYYAKILRFMWLERPEEATPVLHLSAYHGFAIIGLAVPTVVMGLWFGPILAFVLNSLRSIL